MTEPPEPPSPTAIAWLRAGFAQAPPSSEAAPTDPERIWAAVHGSHDHEDDNADRQALIDRLHTDPQLALEWRLAAALPPMSSELEQADVDVARPRWANVTAVVGVAVAVAAALALWLATPAPSQPSGTPEPALRAPAGDHLLQTTLALDAPLPRADFRLHWSSDVLGSPTFTVRVTTRDLAPVHEADGLTETTVQVPAAALEGVPSGSVLLWRVEAIEPDGRRHASGVWEIAVE